jgi:hypothetical protein
MKVFTLVEIEIAEEQIPRGSFIDIPVDTLPDLIGKVAYIMNGKLRVPRHVKSLETLIAGLTSEDLELQKQMLLQYCQPFSPNHIHNKWDEWEKMASAMQSNEGISRDESELEAANKLNLMAFLEDRHMR